MRGTALRAATVFLAVLLVGSCGGGDGGVAPTAPPTASSSPSQTPSQTPSPTATVTVEVFFMNERLGDVCSEAFPVPREVSAAAALRGAFEALLAGPTRTERGEGYEGWFSEETAGLLDSVRVEGTRAHVSFLRTLPQVIPNASSSCGSIGLLAQLDRTATQFPTVEEAWYSLEGDRADFYGWLQFAAPDDPGPSFTPPPPTAPATPTSETPTAEPQPASGRDVPASLIGGEWTSLPTSERVVALTFDAGANGDGVPSILSTLSATGTPATFFLTGNWVVAYPSYTREIGARNPVGNHTRSHPDLTTLSDDGVRAEILSAHDAVAGSADRDPRPWFRFPYGARDDRTIRIVNDLDYGSVRWSVDTLGWKGTSAGLTAETVVTRVLQDLHPGQIVLMHVGSHPTDGSTLDADALPEIIRRVRASGYRFVDLDSLLR